MKSVDWTQKVYSDDKLIAEIERTNIIGERRSYNLMTPLFERTTIVTEFVEPGVWVKVK